jgi:hypothetical protein
MEHVMNANLKLGLLAALLWGGAAEALQPGNTRLQVIAELGAPTGFIRAGKEETLYYERGTVQLWDSKVVDFEIISPEQLRVRQAAAEKARAEQAERTTLWRAQLKVEGEAELKKLLAEPGFAQAPTAVQVERWREFMKKYPDVPVAEYYVPALKRFEAEQARAAQEQRIAALEQRVQDAEQRALQNDTSKWQYPDYYYYPTAIYTPSLYGPLGTHPHEPPHGPTRDAASQNTIHVYQASHQPER